jgi:hypothetical protein
VTESEALLFLEHLAAVIDDDLQLGMSVPARRRIAQSVLDGDYEGPDPVAKHMALLMLRERTLH